MAGDEEGSTFITVGVCRLCKTHTAFYYRQTDYGKTLRYVPLDTRTLEESDRLFVRGSPVSDEDVLRYVDTIENHEDAFWARIRPR